MEENEPIYKEGNHVMLSYDVTQRNDGRKHNKQNSFFVDHIDSIHTIPSKEDPNFVDIVVNNIYRIDNVDITKFHEISVSMNYGYSINQKDYIVEVF